MELKNEIVPDGHIEVIEDGPLKITGNIVFADLKRGITITGSEINICRCTRSSNKPYCDGSCKNKSMTSG
jgi:CDGSH-type Zn-finger protein